MVARDHLPDVEASGQTTSRSHTVAWPCAPPVTTVVDAIIVPSSAHADLYTLLQCGEDSKYGRKAYGGYIEVFWSLLTEDGESSPPASGNF
jgi:hypothetical protein